LLAPGWLHGCLGLWLRLRHHASVQRAKPILLTVLVGLPTLSAFGFLRMTRAVETASGHSLRFDPKLIAHGGAIDTWRHNVLIVYLLLILLAIVAGLLRNRLERQRLHAGPEL
jgi:adenylate cyclase